MIKTLKAQKFKAVPHLETSLLMGNHPGGVKFSLTKPNVIVGPNGAGKTALMTALSLLTWTHFTPGSALDDNYVTGHDTKDWWGEKRDPQTWRSFWEYLPGLDVVTDDGPAFFYRPGHMPGNEDGLTHAMMLGYMNEARAYGKMTKEKSSGQQSSALLGQILDALDGKTLVPKHGAVHWRHGRSRLDLTHRYTGDHEKQADVLIARTNAVKESAIPVILMDEPEQSLDARAEVQLWKRIEAINASKLQVIVATHSLYPLMNPKAFHIVEAVPGYVQEVVSLLSDRLPNALPIAPAQKHVVKKNHRRPTKTPSIEK